MGVMKMDSGISISLVFYAAVFFMCGWGWGQWWNERAIRKEKRELTRGRMTVNMPVNPDDAAATMLLLASLIEEAERNRKAASSEVMKTIQ